jgi:hypothetical protein
MNHFGRGFDPWLASALQGDLISFRKKVKNGPDQRAALTFHEPFLPNSAGGKANLWLPREAKSEYAARASTTWHCGGLEPRVRVTPVAAAQRAAN